ncbi:hypothetical protein BCR42DRAFT_400993 [Absidia repens]|uniref:Uncharacterized protein n=1 Tax=Absidia repens TaxID=90262 RepID=A0A1X2J1Z3_9FUNG|nr:hypothetical protein BCR42DRAFT_400993 [Absidia repens]
MDESTIPKDTGENNDPDGDLSAEDIASEKRTKMLEMVQQLVEEKRDHRVKTSPVASAHMNDLIMGPLSTKVTPSHTIKCKLPDLVNNGPCKLITEETRSDAIVYRFKSVLVDDTINDDLVGHRTWDTAPCLPLSPLASNTTPIGTLTKRDEKMLHCENTTPSSSSSSSSASSSTIPTSPNLVNALAPSFDPRLLDLLATTLTSGTQSNPTPHARNTLRSKNSTSNSGKNQMDLISFDNTPPSPPPSSYSPPRSPVTRAASSTSGLIPTPGLPPSPTTKDPLIHHPTNIRYSRTSFYRPPPRTIVTKRP